MQIYYMHLFITFSFGFIYTAIAKKIGYIDFMWLPSPFTLLMPDNYKSSDLPDSYLNIVEDVTFLRHGGRFIVILLFFLLIFLIFFILSWQKLCKKVSHWS